MAARELCLAMAPTTKPTSTGTGTPLVPVRKASAEQSSWEGEEGEEEEDERGHHDDHHHRVSRSHHW